jgi:methylmalonyl-CoA mutase N-terminal domain/subunit
MSWAARSARSLPAFFQDEIARSAYEHQLRVESGETVVVGVNRFSDDSDPAPIPLPDYSRLEAEQVERVRAAREARDDNATSEALGALAAAAELSDGTFSAPLMPLIVDAVRKRATLGEISDTLAARWGVYRPAS